MQLVKLMKEVRASFLSLAKLFENKTKKFGFTPPAGPGAPCPFRLGSAAAPLALHDVSPEGHIKTQQFLPTSGDNGLRGGSEALRSSP